MLWQFIVKILLNKNYKLVLIMKNYFKLWLTSIFLMSFVFSVCAEEKKAEPLKYVNALNFRMVNKGWTNTETPFYRIPAELKDSVRKDLWNRQQCSAGLGIRFASNSKRIALRYTLLFNTHMFHMADTGLKGMDLYTLTQNGRWEYINTNRPIANEEKVCEKVMVENLDGEMHEYLFYLPLYDGVVDMEIGVDSIADICMPIVNSPRREKKVVMYGTSIMQGGCATRTGMAATNMIQRDLNCEVVNLGFSGEGKMDMCIARAMARISDADVFVLDPVPNCTEMMCDTLTYDFVRTLRVLRPEVPIIMVEGPMYTYAKYDSYFKEYLPKKNVAFRRNYERLIADGYKDIYYVTSDGICGDDNEGTVDGIHFTDIGFRRYADKLIPVIKPLLER